MQVAVIDKRRALPTPAPMICIGRPSPRFVAIRVRGKRAARSRVR
jgi:hypothetical protein